jgi:hypothetical protein
MSPTPSVPFHPEPLPALQARYQDALRELYDQAEIAVGLQPVPSSQPKQVFDHEDGLRLIVSREDSPLHGRLLHLSASFEPETRFFLRLKKTAVRKGPTCAMDRFQKLVERRFAELSGDEKPLEFAGWTAGKLIPHWSRKET